MPYRTIPYLTMPYYTIPYQTLPCHTRSYHTIPWCYTIYHTLQYHTISYLTIPCHVLACIPCHTVIPCRTIPAIPHYTISAMSYNTIHSQKRASWSKSAVTKPITGCVRIACSSLMIISLLQVVNRLAARRELHAGLMQVVSSSCVSLQLSSCSKSDVHRLDGT